MSYTIDITAESLSADEGDAWEEVEQLRDSMDEDEYGSRPGEHFLPLYRKLVARYPCITQPEGEDSPWSDGPLINNFGKKHAILGISYSRVDDALPFIIQTATEMGFTVLDAQDERIHRPSNWVAPPKEPASQMEPKRPWWKIWL